jgi:hypothetical protein
VKAYPAWAEVPHFNQHKSDRIDEGMLRAPRAPCRIPTAGGTGRRGDAYATSKDKLAQEFCYAPTCCRAACAVMKTFGVLR